MAVQAKFVVVDGYHFKNSYFEKLKCPEYQIIKIDDFGNEIDHIDIVLNQNPWANQITYPSKIKQFLGLDYLLLRKEYWRFFGIKAKTHSKNSNVLISLGGSDVHGLLYKILLCVEQAISGTKMNVHVLLPSQYSNKPEWSAHFSRSDNKYFWYKDVVDMPALFESMDVAVCAAGSTCWELAFMNIPMIVFSQAENQQSVAKFVEVLKLGVDLGSCDQLTFPSVEQLMGAFSKLTLVNYNSNALNEIACKTESFIESISLECENSLC